MQGTWLVLKRVSVSPIAWLVSGGLLLAIATLSMLFQLQAQQARLATWESIFSKCSVMSEVNLLVWCGAGVLLEDGPEEEDLGWLNGSGSE